MSTDFKLLDIRLQNLSELAPPIYRCILDKLMVLNAEFPKPIFLGLDDDNYIVLRIGEAYKDDTDLINGARQKISALIESCQE
jgi:hypothetical protein